MDERINQAFESARNSLLAFCILANKDFKTPKHLIRLAKILSQIEKGEKKRVIINIPPRHGKSYLTSQYFPAWFMGKNPSKYVITATYGQDLSDDFGRKVRDTIETPLFKKVFPDCRLKPDSKAISRFETTKDGNYFGVGVGGPATGRGGHLILVDDPIKNREEADSLTMRNKVYDWFRSVLYTRLMPGGACVVVMTRWHQDDLTARLLKDSDKWELITLPALDAHEQPLWPEAYDRETILDIKQQIGEYDFECLYQQNPLPKDGILFKSEWLKTGLPNPDDVTSTYMAVDPAIGQKETNDETAMVVCQTAYGNPTPVYEIDTRHGHWTFHETIQQIQTLYDIYKPQMIGIEDVSYQGALIDECTRLNLPAMPLKAIKDKVARATSVTHLFSQGRMHVNNQALRRQLLSFRGGDERNDMVDALVHCLSLIRDYTQISFEKPKDPPKVSFEEEFRKNAMRKEWQQSTGKLQYDSDDTDGYF